MNKNLLAIMLFSSILISTITYGQRECPKIILPKDLGEEMDKRFYSLHKNLSKYGVIYAPVTMRKGRFLKLLNELWKGDNTIDGFRIYIGQTGTNQIKFILTGLKGDNDTKKYFTLNQSNKGYDSIPKDQAELWVRRFQDSTLPKLNTTNLEQGNTKSYAYSKEILREYISELLFHDEASPVKKIRIKLSVYINNNSNPDPNNIPSYENRIMVGFSLVGEIKEISIDTLKGDYGCTIPKANKTGVGLDTGTPCPPNSCAGITIGQ